MQIAPKELFNAHPLPWRNIWIYSICLFCNKYKI